MLRWILPLAIALSAIPPAEAADSLVPPKSATVKAARQLPPGLPRRPYTDPTTIPGPTQVRRGRQLGVVEPKVIPLNSEPYIPVVRGEPLLPGSSSLPGYYGHSRSYS